ncbi:MAG: hypothetical protein NTU62_00980 [Spirochaetes bacterium]|nr:hypothetical protein [Spirochaetota bacterium]
MRKTVVLVLAVLVLSSAVCAALDIDIGAGYRYQLSVITDFTGYQPLQEHTAYIDLRAWPYPLQLGVGVSRIIIGPSAAPISFVNAILTADYWILDLPLGSLPLSLHVGAGVWAALPVFGFGVRGPVGLRFTPIPADKGFEVSLEVVPVVGGYLAPSLGFIAGASAGLGVRYWFGR